MATVNHHHAFEGKWGFGDTDIHDLIVWRVYTRRTTFGIEYFQAVLRLLEGRIPGLADR